MTLKHAARRIFLVYHPLSNTLLLDWHFLAYFILTPFLFKIMKQVSGKCPGHNILQGRCNSNWYANDSKCSHYILGNCTSWICCCINSWQLCSKGNRYSLARVKSKGYLYSGDLVIADRIQLSNLMIYFLSFYSLIMWELILACFWDQDFIVRGGRRFPLYR